MMRYLLILFLSLPCYGAAFTVSATCTQPCDLTAAATYGNSGTTCHTSIPCGPNALGTGEDGDTIAIPNDTITVTIPPGGLLSLGTTVGSTATTACITITAHVGSGNMVFWMQTNSALVLSCGGFSLPSGFVGIFRGDGGAVINFDASTNAAPTTIKYQLIMGTTALAFWKWDIRGQDTNTCSSPASPIPAAKNQTRRMGEGGYGNNSCHFTINGDSALSPNFNATAGATCKTGGASNLTCLSGGVLNTAIQHQNVSCAPGTAGSCDTRSAPYNVYPYDTYGIVFMDIINVAGTTYAGGLISFLTYIVTPATGRATLYGVTVIHSGILFLLSFANIAATMGANRMAAWDCTGAGTANNTGCITYQVANGDTGNGYFMRNSIFDGPYKIADTTSGANTTTRVPRYNNLMAWTGNAGGAPRIMGGLIQVGDDGLHDGIFTYAQWYLTGTTRNSAWKIIIPQNATRSVFFVGSQTYGVGTGPVSWTIMRSGQSSINSVHNVWGQMAVITMGSFIPTANISGGILASVPPTTTLQMNVHDNTGLAGWNGSGTLSNQAYYAQSSGGSPIANLSENLYSNTIYGGFIFFGTLSSPFGGMGLETRTDYPDGMVNQEDSDWILRQTPGDFGFVCGFTNLTQTYKPITTVTNNLLMNTASSSPTWLCAGDAGTNWVNNAASVPTVNKNIPNHAPVQVDMYATVPDFDVKFLIPAGLISLTNYTGTTDFNGNPQNYRGAWTAATVYNPGDIVYDSQTNVNLNVSGTATPSGIPFFGGTVMYWRCLQTTTGTTAADLISRPGTGNDQSGTNPYMGYQQFWQPAWLQWGWINTWQGRTFNYPALGCTSTNTELTDSTDCGVGNLLNAWLQHAYISLDPNTWQACGIGFTHGDGTINKYGECGAMAMAPLGHLLGVATMSN